LQAYIWANRTEDPQRLALRRHADFPMAHVAAQVAALQKMRLKVPSWYRPDLEFPAALSVEQASSEQTARFKASLVSGRRMADLSGGLGVDAFCFAQRFEAFWHVEQQAALSALVVRNFSVLGLGHVRVEATSAEAFLARDLPPLDWVYLDPARRDGGGGRVFRLEDCQPNVLEIKELIWKKSANLLLKTAPMLDISLALRQLGQVCAVWVLAVGDECREVLYHLRPEGGPALEALPICAVQLLPEGASRSFCFTWAEEQAATVAYAPPGRYLLEPNAALLKAGAFRSFAQRFGLAKLHPNTQLYTTDAAPAPDVPARVFEVLHTCKYDKKALLALLPEAKANVSVRNFPDSAEQLRKRLGLRDGGPHYLFAFTGPTGEKTLALCRK
jgi:hypothetical protein